MAQNQFSPSKIGKNCRMIGCLEKNQKRIIKEMIFYTADCYQTENTQQNTKIPKHLCNVLDIAK